MALKIAVSVHQDGNEIVVRVDDRIINYRVEGIKLPKLTNHAFAVWHVLPEAMRTGAVIEVDGPLDSGTQRAAQRFSETWELWKPKNFRQVVVQSRTLSPPSSTGRRKDLAMFSGGLDSAYMLLSLGCRPQKACALTVQGLDYSVDADISFQALKDKVRPLLDHLNYDHAVVRTNATSVTASGKHSYALRLMGASSLLSGVFAEGCFAPDWTLAQDMSAFPWGTNHITNSYLRTDDFILRPRDEDVFRSEKVAFVANEPVALKSISFCPDRSVSPDNCGRCDKCVRTKLMFMVETGEVPPIFLDTRLDAGTLDVLDLNDRKMALYFIESFQRARAAGVLDRVAGLEEKFVRHFRTKPKTFRRAVLDLLPVTGQERVRQLARETVIVLFAHELSCSC